MHHGKVFRHYLWIILCFSLLLAFRPITAQATKTPHFGEGVVMLQLPDRFLTNPIISPDGNYVFVTANLLSQWLQNQGFNLFRTMHSANQYIWRIYDSSFGSGLIYQRPNWELDIDQTVMEPAAAFSPDGHYLATRSSTQLQLFSVPDWLEIQTHPLNTAFDIPTSRPFRHLQWSADGRLVATLDGTEVIVWDIATDSIYRHTLPLTHARDAIIPIDDGWVIELHDYDLEESATFAVCSELLETCNQYTHKEVHIAVASPDGQTIFTGLGYCPPERDLVVWQQHNGQYLRNDQLDIPPEFRDPISFNKAGNYLLTSSYPCQSWAIWDFPALSLVSTIPSPSHHPIWLPDNNHIVTFFDLSSGKLTLHLYQVGSDVAVDELELTDFPDIKEIKKRDERVQVSANGKRLLVNLGWAALVIPIEYE